MSSPLALTCAPMPKAFDACRRQGGHIRTKKLSGGRYIPICFKKTKHGEKSYAGHVHHRKSARGGGGGRRRR
jgi:hypothetical protein